MTVEFEYILKLLKCSIFGEVPPLPVGEINWEALYGDALAHRIAPVIYNAVKELPEGIGPSGEMLTDWKSQSVTQGFQQMRKMSQLREIIKTAEAENVKIAVIKGPVLSNLYPSSYSRACVDADLLVTVEDKERAKNVLISLGYTSVKENLSDYEDTYENGVLDIELHTRLWEEKEGERYDRLAALGIDMDRLTSISVEGWPAWTLSPQDMLVYLFYHMIKHFFLCGIGIRYLSDMVLFARRYSGEVSWNVFWDQVKSLGYTSFCRSFLCLCVDYMGLTEELVGGLEISDADRDAAQEMLEDIRDGGHNGRRTIIRSKAGRMMWLYYNKGSDEIPKSRIQIIKQLLSYKSWEIDEHRTQQFEYSGLKLLAWIQFVFIWVINKFKDRYSLRERINCVEKRVDMLKSLDLIE